MKAVIQRVSEASVTVDQKITGAVKTGLLVLVGISPTDDRHAASALAKKIAKLRIFEDSAGKMNLSVHDVGGAILAVSQFTLYADTSHGNRPSFSGAAKPDTAIPLYDFFCAELRAQGLTVETGVFGASMRVCLVNEGPVTIILEEHGEAGKTS